MMGENWEMSSRCLVKTEIKAKNHVFPFDIIQLFAPKFKRSNYTGILYKEKYSIVSSCQEIMLF